MCWKIPLTENGYVSRGICGVDEAGYLRSLVERTHIEIRDGRAMYTEDGGASWNAPGGLPGVHELLGFPGRYSDRFEDIFRRFLSSGIDPLKSEFYLPLRWILWWKAARRTSGCWKPATAGTA